MINENWWLAKKLKGVRFRHTWLPTFIFDQRTGEQNKPWHHATIVVYCTIMGHHAHRPFCFLWHTCVVFFCKQRNAGPKMAFKLFNYNSLQHSIGCGIWPERGRNGRNDFFEGSGLNVRNDVVYGERQAVDVSRLQPREFIAPAFGEVNFSANRAASRLFLTIYCQTDLLPVRILGWLWET